MPPPPLTSAGAGAQRTPAGETLRKAAGNLRPRVDILPADGLNVYDVVRKRVVVMTEQAVREAVEKLNAPIRR